MQVYIGTAGVPLSCKKRSTEEGIKMIKEIGLSCMEVEFVQGVKMSEDKAQEVRKLAEELNVKLTVHGPYAINLNSKEKDKVEASKQRIIDSAKIGYLMGAEYVTFHPGYYGDDSTQNTYIKIKNALIDVLESIDKLGIKIKIAPETTGKEAQFGSLDEIISLAEEIECLSFCIDFAHIYAREQGKYNSYEEFISIIDRIPKKHLDLLHIHISGIEYSEKGEKNHLIFNESKFKYKELLRALYDKNISCIIICESPNLESDALLLKKTYQKICVKTIP